VTKKKCVIQTECKSPDTHQLKPPQTKLSRAKSGCGVGVISGSGTLDLDHSFSLNDLPPMGAEPPSPQKPKGMSHAIKTLVGPKRTKKMKEKEKIPGYLSSDDSEDEGTEKNEKKKDKKTKTGMKRLSSAALPRKKVVSKSRDWSRKPEELKLGESEKKRRG